MLGHVLFLFGCHDNVPAVVNSAPSVLIQTPESESQFSIGESILFEGIVIDDQPSSEIDIIWNSDKDGILFEGNPSSEELSSFTTDTLSLNVHIITISASDGLSSESDWIEIRIIE